MSDPMTAPQTPAAGRELDRAVAEAMGWKRYTYGHGVRCHLIPPDVAARDSFYEPAPPEMLPADQNHIRLPAYSAPDFSGFTPVLAWLTENRPTREQAKEMLCIEVTQVNLVLANDGSRWYAQYLATPADFENETLVLLEDVHEILPEAGCRLVLAWAKRRAET